MPEGITIACTNPAANRRRVRLEPREPGGWARIEEEFDASDDRWRPIGQEIVADPAIELTASRELVSILSVEMPDEDPIGTEIRGP